MTISYHPTRPLTSWLLTALMIANATAQDVVVEDGERLKLEVLYPGDAYRIGSNATLEISSADNLAMSGGQIAGDGLLRKTGKGSLMLGSSNLKLVNVALSSFAEIRVEEGTLVGSAYGQGVWSQNKADLTILKGATFDASEGNIYCDSLNGDGVFKGTYWDAPITVTLGVADGSGTFGGSFFQNKNVALSLVKEGGGVQALTGVMGYLGSTTVKAGRLVLHGLSDSPLYSIAAGAGLEIHCSDDRRKNLPVVRIAGGGSFIKSGPGRLAIGRWQETPTKHYQFAMEQGGMIRIENGSFCTGDYNLGFDFDDNRSSLYIAEGATFSAFNSDVNVDALDGKGSYLAEGDVPRRLSIGVANGSGTFSGMIKSVKEGGPILIKKGNGSQILDGNLQFKGSYSQNSIEVRDGVSASPSVLTLNPTVGSTVGYKDGGVILSPGINDVTVLNHLSGSLKCSVLAVGDKGQATYNFFKGTTDVEHLELAWRGGGNNGPAEMNIGNEAMLRILNNGHILMGQYWGRPVTVNQRGGSVIQFGDNGVTRGGVGEMQFFSASHNVCWNLSGGLLSIAGIAWNPSGGGSGGGNGVFNLNGGILQITNSSFSVPTGTINGLPVISANVLGDDLSPNSGARLDNYGLNVKFAAPLLHAGSRTFDGGLSVESSVTGGSLSLSGRNTYSGDTIIAAGNTLILTREGELTFVVAGRDATKLTGSGTVNLAGVFRIDTTLADTTRGTSWSLVEVANRSFDPVTFAVAGFSKAGGTWTKVEGSNTWTFKESNGTLALSATPAGYATWVGRFSGLSDTSPEGDPDNDGISNILEYVLNGDAGMPDGSILPILNISGSAYVFTFIRREESEIDTTQVFLYGSDSSGWTSLNITGAVDPKVRIGLPSGGLQSVTVTIPKSEVGGRNISGKVQVSQ